MTKAIKNLKILALVCIVGAAFYAVPTLANKRCKALMAKARAPEMHQVRIWRYAGQKDFERARFAELTMGKDDLYYQLSSHGNVDSFGDVINNNLHPEQIKFLNLFSHSIMPEIVDYEKKNQTEGKTSGLLDMNQDYPLQIMQDSGYIDEKVRSDQSQVVHRLNTDQVTFIDIAETWSAKNLRAQYGKIPKDAVEDGRSYNLRKFQAAYGEYSNTGPHFYNLKTGSIWLINGQSVGRQFHLPLEGDNPVAQIDRQKYPFVWEVGRLAQTKKGAFETGLKQALFVALYELALLGGDIDQAYIFSHSLDRAHTELFKRHFGMTELFKYPNSPEETALVGPIKKLIEWYIKHTKVDVYTNVPQNIRKDLGLFEWIKKVIAYHRQQNGHFDTQGTKIRIEYRNFSKYSSYDNQLYGVNLSRQRDYVRLPRETNLRIFSGTQLNKKPIFSEDTRDYETLSQFLSRNKAIEIYIQSSEAMSMESLKAAISSAVKRLVQLLGHHQFNVAITGNTTVTELLNTMGDAPRWELYRHPVVMTRPMSWFRREESQYYPAYLMQSAVVPASVVQSWAEYETTNPLPFSTRESFYNLFQYY